jgi:hypothetical protein
MLVLIMMELLVYMELILLELKVVVRRRPCMFIEYCIVVYLLLKMVFL